MRIHITNGSYFNQWFEKQTTEKGIVFHEAMMSGTVRGLPFDSEFVKHRSQHHHVSAKKYLDLLKPLLEVLEHVHEVDEFVLWFGQDAFCQMNVLTMMKALSLKGYTGKVKIVCFDENQAWEPILHQHPKEVQLKQMESLYQTVLVERKRGISSDPLMQHAIDLFLDLHDENGRLMKLIYAHEELDEIDLVKLLMEHSKEEGLSDVQALEMIKKAREKQ